MLERPGSAQGAKGRPALFGSDLDKEVAKAFKAFGVTARMVSKCRTDPRMRPFLPREAWVEREWEAPAKRHFTAKQIAKQLMTPERLAKGEPLALDGDALLVLDKTGQLHAEGLLSELELRACREFQATAYNAGIPLKTETEVIVGPAPAGFRGNVIGPRPPAVLDPPRYRPREARGWFFPWPGAAPAGVGPRPPTIAPKRPRPENSPRPLIRRGQVREG